MTFLILGLGFTYESFNSSSEESLPLLLLFLTAGFFGFLSVSSELALIYCSSI
jgi:hypothetical protein